MDGRTDGSVTISLRNFVGEGIINCDQEHLKSGLIRGVAFGGSAFTIGGLLYRH
jgi:hypothetical protein